MYINNNMNSNKILINDTIDDSCIEKIKIFLEYFDNIFPGVNIFSIKKEKAMFDNVYKYIFFCKTCGDINFMSRIKKVLSFQKMNFIFLMI